MVYSVWYVLLYGMYCCNIIIYNFMSLLSFLLELHHVQPFNFLVVNISFNYIYIYNLPVCA